VIPLDRRRSVYQEGKLVRKPTGYEQKKLTLRRPASGGRASRTSGRDPSA